MPLKVEILSQRQIVMIFIQFTAFKLTTEVKNCSTQKSRFRNINITGTILIIKVRNWTCHYWVKHQCHGHIVHVSKDWHTVARKTGNELLKLRIENGWEVSLCQGRRVGKLFLGARDRRGNFKLYHCHYTIYTSFPWKSKYFSRSFCLLQFIQHHQVSFYYLLYTDIP